MCWLERKGFGSDKGRTIRGMGGAFPAAATPGWPVLALYMEIT
jgi:hypothetical protein